jgi:hypothetical protein
MQNRPNDGMNAKERYEAKMVKLQIRLNTETDADIIEFLETVPSKQAFIKEIIREKIRNN